MLRQVRAMARQCGATSPPWGPAWGAVSQSVSLGSGSWKICLTSWRQTITPRAQIESNFWFWLGSFGGSWLSRTVVSNDFWIFLIDCSWFSNGWVLSRVISIACFVCLESFSHCNQDSNVSLLVQPECPTWTNSHRLQEVCLSSVRLTWT